MSYNDEANQEQNIEQGLEAVASLSEETTQQQQQEQPQENANDRNIRNLREEKLRLQKENEELRRYYQYVAQQKQAPQQEEEEEDLGINPNEFIEGKQLSKLYAQQRKELRALREEIKSSQQQLTYQTVKSQFPDFERVVTNENIERLKIDHPEIVEMLNESQNIYAKAASAYKIIKNLGIHQDENSYTNNAARQKVQSNLNKPRPVQSVQGSALSQANSFIDEDLTDERKAQIWNEVNKFRSNRNVF